MSFSDRRWLDRRGRWDSKGTTVLTLARRLPAPGRRMAGHGMEADF